MEEIKPTTESEEVKYQPTTLKQFSAEFSCDPKTFLKWIAPIQSQLGERIGHFYNPRQVKIIRGHLSMWVGFVAFFKGLFRTEPGPYDLTSYDSDSYANENVNHSKDPGVPDFVSSSTIFYPVLSILSVILMVTGIKTLIEISIDHPRQRSRYAKLNPHDATLMKGLRITVILFQVVASGIAVIMIGYVVGKWVL